MQSDPNFHYCTSPDDLIGFSYDFIVEQYLTEFKLDKESIVAEYEQLQSDPNNYDTHKFKLFKLYPEWNEKDPITLESLPKTVHKEVYFVQSPRKNDAVTHFYSVEQHMLTDLRAQRSRVKKDLAKAQQAHDAQEASRFDAKQLAIKVVCNTQYGASNNTFFAKYDPEVSGAVTHTSRQTIAFLTQSLESDTLYVDDEFLNLPNVREDLPPLISIGAVKMTKIKPDLHTLLKHRRSCVNTIFTETYQLATENIYELSIHPSVVVYQDTDSNYYVNPYIRNYYSENETIMTPSRMDEMMHMMLHHDMLISQFVTSGFHRKPISPGFEGAFMICRYLNRKKKYYGIKWGDDAELKLAARLPEEAYQNEVLIMDYSKYWKPKTTVYPQPNGDYISIDMHKLLDEETNFLDYIRSQNCKCTGVDLARRDQYRFINFFHIYILQQDLRLMRYCGNNDWEMFPLNVGIIDTIEEVIADFEQIVKTYINIANFRTISGQLPKPKIPFNILAFSKTVAYRKGKSNMASDIINRLEAEGKNKYAPGAGARLSYVVLLDEITATKRSKGTSQQTKKSDRAYLIEELQDIIKSELPMDAFQQKLIENDIPPEDLSYDDWINAVMISRLDHRYYLQCLAKALSLYILSDKYPAEIKAIDEGQYTTDESKEKVSKMQTKIAEEYTKKYYPTGKTVADEIKIKRKNLDKNIVFKADDYKILSKFFSKYFNSHDDKLYRNDINDMSDKLTVQRDKIKKKQTLLMSLWERLRTNTPITTTKLLTLYNSYGEMNEGDIMKQIDSELDKFSKLLSCQSQALEILGRIQKALYKSKSNVWDFNE